jgi:hypothetical protein
VKFFTKFLHHKKRFANIVLDVSKAACHRQLSVGEKLMEKTFVIGGFVASFAARPVKCASSAGQ